MKRAPRSRQRHDLYAKYHDYDSEISDLLGECGLRMFRSMRAFRLASVANRIAEVEMWLARPTAAILDYVNAMTFIIVPVFMSGITFLAFILSPELRSMTGAREGTTAITMLMSIMTAFSFDRGLRMLFVMQNPQRSLQRLHARYASLEGAGLPAFQLEAARLARGLPELGLEIPGGMTREDQRKRA